MIGFGARLKVARKAKKLTQKEVAELLNLHRTAYTKYKEIQPNRHSTHCRS